MFLNNIATPSAIVLIVLIIFAIKTILYIIKADKVDSDGVYISAYVGSMGTGKTAHAVYSLLKEWKKRKKPPVYSNIPIKLDKKTYSFKLTRDILRGEVAIQENSLILIDEVSAEFNQYDYRGYELEDLFLRLSRQFANIKWYLTEQRYFKMPLFIRGKVTNVYVFQQAKTIFGFWLSSKFKRFTVVEGMTTVNESEEEEPHTFIFLGFHKRYDTRAFKDTYKQLPLNNDEPWTNLKMPVETYDILKKEILKKKNRKKSVKSEKKEEIEVIM